MLLTAYLNSYILARLEQKALEIIPLSLYHYLQVLSQTFKPT